MQKEIRMTIKGRRMIQEIFERKLGRVWQLGFYSKEKERAQGVILVNNSTIKLNRKA